VLRPAVAATCCLLAIGAPLALGACGGDGAPVDEIPKTAPALLPPEDANDIAGSGRDDTRTTTDTTDTTTPDTGGATDGSGTTGTGTGGTGAPGAGTGGATGGTGTGGAGTGGAGAGTGGAGETDTGGTAPNPGGVTPDAAAGADSFQGFCDANPGAC
jgi:hypothetical protein